MPDLEYDTPNKNFFEKRNIYKTYPNDQKNENIWISH